jgi:flagellin-like hook-associated protein FlgL
MMVNQFLRNLMTLNEKLISSQFKLSKGVNYAKPSDGPLEVGRILGFYSTEASFTQFRKNISDGASQVEYLDTLLQDMVTRVTNAHTKTVHGANDVLQSADRKAIALEMDQYLNAMYQDSQTRFRDKYIFAGYRTLVNPFKGSFSKWDSYLNSVEYLGDRGEIGRRIGDFTRLPVNIRGNQLFLEQTYSLEGKVISTDVPLGFSGTITINNVDIKIETTNTLEDIRNKINNSDDIKVYASADSGYLKLESTTSSEKIEISDNQNGLLLDYLGLNVRGAYTRGINAPTLPVIDSTGAIFDAAGAVANLVYDETNNTLNLHLGADANDGVAAHHSIKIPAGTYADAAELARVIQTEVDSAFGENKIIVEEIGGALRFTTYETGASISTGDLQVGGEIDGVLDTASDAANLNLVAGPSPALLTDAQTTGTDGTDKFSIDIGRLITRADRDPEPVTIDLRASQTGTLSELVEEINFQLNQDLILRGTVRAREYNGRLLLETVKTGQEVKADQMQIADITSGTLAGLGLLNAESAAYIDGVPPPAFPVTITTGVNDTMIIDIGPTVSRNGINHDPITLTLRPGTYNNITELRDQLNLRINSSPELFGSIVAVVEGPPGGEYLRITSLDKGSDVNGADLAITGGTALADLGFSVATAIDGGGVTEGKGIVIQPQNIFNTLIQVRDSLLGLAALSTPVNRLVDKTGTLIDIYDGDKITFEQGGRSLTITYRTFDTIEDLLNTFNDFMGTKAQARLDRSGRIVIENLTNQKIEGLKISCTSSDGLAERALFNGIFKIDDTVLGFGSIATDVLSDPSRHELLGESLISMVQEDMENFMSFQAFVGSTANRLTRTSNLIETKDYNVKSLRNEIEAADIAKLIMEITQTESVLQASMNVGARIIMPSLLDYLR